MSACTSATATGTGAEAARIATERERLEAVAGTRVTGSRHHYWHMTRPFWASLEAHGRAGLLYDISVASTSAPGYRLGVALPFQTWNPETGSVVPTLQVPTLAMDSMLMSPRVASVDSVIERFDGVLATLKRYAQGVARSTCTIHVLSGLEQEPRLGRGVLGSARSSRGRQHVVLVQTYDELVAAVATQAFPRSAGQGHGASLRG